MDFDPEQLAQLQKNARKWQEDKPSPEINVNNTQEEKQLGDKELPEAGHDFERAKPNEKTFKARTKDGRVEDFRDRRKSEYHGKYQFEFEGERVEIPLTKEERRERSEEMRKNHDKKMKYINTREKYNSWSAIGTFALSVLGAVGLSLAIYKGVKSESKKH
jgi:hypothetical protein